MRTLFILFLLGFAPLHAKEEAKAVGMVHLYGYLHTEWLPFANAELISVKPGLVRFKTESREIEHSGRFSIEQVAPKRESKWWQFGGATKPERVGMVILYDFMKLEMIPFRDADIFERQEGFIVFEVGDKRYTHCGRYSIQR